MYIIRVNRILGSYIFLCNSDCMSQSIALSWAFICIVWLLPLFFLGFFVMTVAIRASGDFHDVMFFSFHVFEYMYLFSRIISFSSYILSTCMFSNIFQLKFVFSDVDPSDLPCVINFSNDAYSIKWYRVQRVNPRERSGLWRIHHGHNPTYAQVRVIIM